MSRRSFLRASLLTAGGVGLAGCSTVGAGLANRPLAPGTVEYWNLFGGGDGVRQQQMLDGFKKRHPDIGLQGTTWAWGNPYYTKLSLATVGERPPDVAVAHLTRMKTLVAGNLVQELLPEDLARHGLSKENFNPKTWEASLVNGKAYALPLDTHPQVIFYNTKLCKQAGLLDSNGKLKPMDGEQAFIDALTRAKKVTGKYGITAPVPEASWRLFNTLYSQLGGKVLANNGTKLVFDDAKAKRVLNYMRTLTVEKKLMSSIDYQSSIALFVNGQAPMHWNGEWEITTFQTAKMPFSMASVPNVFGKYAVQSDSHTFLIPKHPDHNQARLDRALTFIRTMLDQSLIWAQGGHIPAWLPTRDSAAYKALKPQSDYAASANAAVYDDPGWYSGSGSDFENITGASIAAVQTGLLSPDAAIAQMRSKLSALANTPSPA